MNRVSGTGNPEKRDSAEYSNEASEPELLRAGLGVGYRVRVTGKDSNALWVGVIEVLESDRTVSGGKVQNVVLAVGVGAGLERLL